MNEITKRKVMLFTIVIFCCIIVSSCILYYAKSTNDIQTIPVNISDNITYDDTGLYRSWQYNSEHPMQVSNNTYTNYKNEQTYPSVSDYYFGYQYAWHPFNYWNMAGYGW